MFCDDQKSEPFFLLIQSKNIFRKSILPSDVDHYVQFSTRMIIV